MTSAGGHSLEICPDCGIALPAVDQGAHSYLGASPSCWALYGQILAREYSDPGYRKVHRRTVDAYAVQHPGRPERRTIQSIHVHLAGLYLALEKRCSDAFVRKVMAALSTQADLPWLEPPDDKGAITVLDVLPATTAEAHRAAVAIWARSVWDAWTVHHVVVARRTDAVARSL